MIMLYVLLDDVLRTINEENELDLSYGRHNLEFQDIIKKLPTYQFDCKSDFVNKETKLKTLIEQLYEAMFAVE